MKLRFCTLEVTAGSVRTSSVKLRIRNTSHFTIVAGPVLGRCERCDRTGRHQEGGAKMNQNVRQKTLDLARESRDTRTKKLPSERAAG
ncbi:hypothetical protein EVAR_15027_1 [Eumeta japonica]|uniref:Uncharacterized protein n=1 Tax=Eumeta variegata TaxID=151549 RepID=A0A4C1X9J8_EUMVA|nr:hypothetical protein EVAR_15027_1 [Eumeta japonica]